VEPLDSRLDPDLVRDGDTRNVVDKYRLWSMDAIIADLAATRSPLHVAIENLEHDLNIGSIVRTCNAFNVGAVHVVGRRRWNRRGAMVTDRYIDVRHDSDPQSLRDFADAEGYRLIAIDNVGEPQALESAVFPEKCILVFGQESAGISAELLAVCDAVVEIPMYGSTRSMNVAAAAAIVIHWWGAQWRAGRTQG